MPFGFGAEMPYFCVVMMTSSELDGRQTGARNFGAGMATWSDVNFVHNVQKS